MSSRVLARPTVGLPLFPLLAVLLCTTGAMLVLLVAFARHGHLLAARAAEVQAALADAPPEADLDELKWRIGQMQESRSKTEAQLAERRLQLSHIEDHERRLREDLERLRTSLAEMQRVGEAKADERRLT